MTPKATSAAIDSHGGTSVVARAFGTDRSTIKRAKKSGATGERAKLLGLLVSGKITIKDVEQANE